jgi:hypothetical protein
MAMACAFPMGFVNAKLATPASTVPLVHTNLYDSRYLLQDYFFVQEVFISGL